MTEETKERLKKQIKENKSDRNPKQTHTFSLCKNDSVI